jgi:hypothetical protein
MESVDALLNSPIVFVGLGMLLPRLLSLTTATTRNDARIEAHDEWIKGHGGLHGCVRSMQTALRALINEVRREFATLREDHIRLTNRIERQLDYQAQFRQPPRRQPEPYDFAGAREFLQEDGGDGK